MKSYAACFRLRAGKALVDTKVKSSILRIALTRRELKQISAMAEKAGQPRSVYLGFQLRESLLKPGKRDSAKQTDDALP
jgi:hypothetical protein